MRLDPFLKNNIIMFAAGSLGSFFNLFYQLVMVRVVSKEIFASLNSLLSLLVIIAVPCLSFTTMVTKHVSTHNARKKGLELRHIWQSLSKHASLFSLAVFILVVVLRGVIADFLHLESNGGVWMLAFIFFLSGISAVITGGLQGLERFKWIAVISVSSGLLKLIFPVVFISFIANSLSIALLGFLLPTLITIILSLIPLKPLLRKVKSTLEINFKELYFYMLPALLVSLCFAVLTNIDMILVKHFFLTEAQDYSLAQMIGKIILSISGVVYMVMFPRVSNLHALNQDSKRILRRSLAFAFILSFSAVAVYNIFPEVIFKALIGQVNTRGVVLARMFSLVMFFYALSNVLFYYQLSVEYYGFIRKLSALAVLQILAIWLFHNTTFNVLCVMLVISFLVFLFNLRSAFGLTRAYEEYKG